MFACVSRSRGDYIITPWLIFFRLSYIRSKWLKHEQYKLNHISVVISICFSTSFYFLLNELWLNTCVASNFLVDFFGCFFFSSNDTFVSYKCWLNWIKLEDEDEQRRVTEVDSCLGYFVELLNILSSFT